ncbi:MAG: response regulator [Candidatus Omnitrophica bacterium]|nr:response regulator [Candidatus Omnitrophota bacterium]
MAKAKILLIDDEKEFLDFMIKGLKPADYDVITAEDGSEGVRKAMNDNPDMIICDVKMPKKDGFEVLREIRANASFSRVPFIMLTAVDELKKVREAYDEDANFYVAKPVEFSRLLKHITMLLDLQRSRKEELL